jgi:hypothetical protein
MIKSRLTRPALTLLIGSAWLAALAVAAPSQQVADPSFEAKVARPTYTTRHPKVLFDEAHHNFHTSGGRYKAFSDLITNDGYRVTPNREKFRRETLAGYRVLVISNALGAETLSSPEANNPAFTEEECDAVRDWVRAGGALLLIADHYPCGGAAARLGERFGLGMSNGYTDDPDHHDPQLRNILFSRENGFLTDHPITRGRSAAERITRVVTFTGQSLTGPAGSVAFLKLADTAFDLLPPDRQKVSAAGRAQGLAFKFGRGRVVALGEAAMLSAQLAGPNRSPFGGLNRPGIDNRQLALNIMHWLSGRLN